MSPFFELVFNKLQTDSNLDEKFIKILNQTINTDIKETDGYRRVQVFINGTEYIPPEAERIPNLMNYYIYNYNHNNQDIYTKLARYHIEFERIHPFEDVNGRTGRLLLIFELLKNNLYPVVITKEDRIKYFEFLNTQNIAEFAEFLKQLSEKEKDRIKKFGFINKH